MATTVKASTVKAQAAPKTLPKVNRSLDICLGCGKAIKRGVLCKACRADMGA